MALCSALIVCLIASWSTPKTAPTQIVIIISWALWLCRVTNWLIRRLQVTHFIAGVWSAYFSSMKGKSVKMIFIKSQNEYVMKEEITDSLVVSFSDINRSYKKEWDLIKICIFVKDKKSIIIDLRRQWVSNILICWSYFRRECKGIRQATTKSAPEHPCAPCVPPCRKDEKC